MKSEVQLLVFIPELQAKIHRNKVCIATHATVFHSRSFRCVVMMGFPAHG